MGESKDTFLPPCCHLIHQLPHCFRSYLYKAVMIQLSLNSFCHMHLIALLIIAPISSFLLGPLQIPTPPQDLLQLS